MTIISLTTDFGLADGYVGIENPFRFAPIHPVYHTDGHVSGEILYADHFGNLISNIPTAWVMTGCWQCRITGASAHLVAAYAEIAFGARAGLINSDGAVEIAVHNGNAA
jgi:S-adenosylmethionine hydrolase